jgi:hypothetical protein
LKRPNVSVILLLAAAFVLLAVAVSPAQTPQPQADPRAGALRVFFDCDACDDNYLRTEITFVDHMRDRADADVHVLVTTQQTGGGGVEYTIKYIGLGRFAGIEQTLKHFAAQTQTDDERRAGLATILRLGLVRYAAETPLASRIKIGFDAPKTAGPSTAARDPWNYWTFRLGASGELDGEESGSERSFSGSISANRTTNAWKLAFDVAGEFSREKFVLDEGETFTSDAKEIEFDALVTKSLTGHWSAGLVGAMQTSIFSNYDLRTRLGGGLEYDVFPYAESTKRILALMYTVGVETADYRELTVFGELSETLMDHRFESTLNLTQPWGSASASFELVQYLSKPDKYRISTFGDLEVRLFKGFALELFAEASRRRDQLSLRRGDATNEEILVRQRELATGYEYEFGFGISYTFGSIFNNIVNPRFRGAGGF